MIDAIKWENTGIKRSLCVLLLLFVPVVANLSLGKICLEILITPVLLSYSAPCFPWLSQFSLFYRTVS